jgi:hypothetical protein
MKVRKTVAESLGPKYHLEHATSHKLDIDSGRTKDSGARLAYELRNYVTTLATTHFCNTVIQAESVRKKLIAKLKYCKSHLQQEVNNLES